MNNLDMYTESFKLKLEKFLLGCDAIEELGLWDKEQYGEMDVFYQNDLVSIIIRLIAADGVISGRDVDYLNKNFGFSYSIAELRDVYQNCREEIGHSFDETFENGITLMRSINEKLADAYKELLSLICDIIIESDGVVTETEQEEVKRLKAL